MQWLQSLTLIHTFGAHHAGDSMERRCIHDALIGDYTEMLYWQEQAGKHVGTSTDNSKAKVTMVGNETQTLPADLRHKMTLAAQRTKRQAPPVQRDQSSGTHGAVRHRLMQILIALGCLGASIVCSLSIRWQQQQQKQHRGDGILGDQTKHGVVRTAMIELQDQRKYEELRRVKRRGDGNCFWRSIAAARWKEAKALVRRQSKDLLCHFSLEEQLMIEQALRPGAWVNEPTIRLAVMVLELDLWICTRRPGGRQWTTEHRVCNPEATAAQYRVVAYDEHHYDTIKAKSRASRHRRVQLRIRQGPEGHNDEADKEPVGHKKMTHPPPIRGRLNKMTKKSTLQEEVKTARWSKKKKSQMAKRTSSQRQDEPDADAPPLPDHNTWVGWMAAAGCGQLMDAMVRCSLRRGDPSLTQAEPAVRGGAISVKRRCDRRASEFRTILRNQVGNPGLFGDYTNPNSEAKDLGGGGLRTPHPDCSWENTHSRAEAKNTPALSRIWVRPPQDIHRNPA